jgi:23S rRNA (adenine2503-C2)-methyltransferase
MKNFFEFTRRELAETLGHKTRAARLFNKVYQGAPLSSASDVAAFQDFAVEGIPIARRFDSSDGTRRYLFRLDDKEQAESVTIPEESRFTFCVSSQIGCALACRFCLTGQLGLTRNLSAGEIVSQVVAQRADLGGAESRRCSVVFMGMGEPLQNYDNVMRSIEILTDDHGLAIPLNRITLSTAGLVPAIQTLGREKLFPNLSISLTGATNSKRDDLMPINRKYPIEEVIQAVRDLPASLRRRVMFEYVMLKDVTDDLRDAHHLASLLKGLNAKVNLIPLNESPDLPFERSERGVILRFQQLLLQNGITTFIRRTRGDDVSAACGQLHVTQSAQL